MPLSPTCSSKWSLPCKRLPPHLKMKAAIIRCKTLSLDLRGNLSFTFLHQMLSWWLPETVYSMISVIISNNKNNDFKKAFPQACFTSTRKKGAWSRLLFLSNTLRNTLIISHLEAEEKVRRKSFPRREKQSRKKNHMRWTIIKRKAGNLPWLQMHTHAHTHIHARRNPSWQKRCQTKEIAKPFSRLFW